MVPARKRPRRTSRICEARLDSNDAIVDLCVRQAKVWPEKAWEITSRESRELDWGISRKRRLERWIVQRSNDMSASG